MAQQTTPVIQAGISLLILLLFFILAIAFLALVSVETTLPLPHEKTTVALVVREQLV